MFLFKISKNLCKNVFGLSKCEKLLCILLDIGCYSVEYDAMLYTDVGPFQSAICLLCALNHKSNKRLRLLLSRRVITVFFFLSSHDRHTWFPQNANFSYFVYVFGTRSTCLNNSNISKNRNSLIEFKKHGNLVWWFLWTLENKIDFI